MTVRAWPCVVLFAVGTSCARSESGDKGGVVLHISQEKPFALDELDVGLRAGTTVENWKFRIPQDKTLPDTVGVVSNGEPAAVVNVEVAAYVKSGAVLSLIDRRELTLPVPHDRIVDEYLVLSARCPVSETGNSNCPALPPRDAADAPSCALSGDGRDNCGPEAESCCTSLIVLDDQFLRSNDPTAPAQVSGFRLDKYEITVGRFRAFTRAVIDGWAPSDGAGKHTHLNGGKGLLSTNGSFEEGWVTSLAHAALPTTASGWNDALGCDPNLHLETWPAEPTDERRPINCITWFEAQAFCIWDGGFLPSEAEWNNAAAAGLEQRLYPWSSPPSSLSIDPAHASYWVDDTIECGGDGLPGCSLADLVDVGSKTPGYGRYGQSDLAGNVWEWTLDTFDNAYAQGPCDDCANLRAGGDRVVRGGGLGAPAKQLRNTFRDQAAPATRRFYTGARCARVP